MKEENKLDTVSFNRFITTDEGKRGYVFSFKGEANTTFRSFFQGLFSFIFSRRITTMSAYNENAQRVITNNYVDRINSGLIDRFPSETVKNYIEELNVVIQKENQKFWSAGTPKVIMKVRVLQRAHCYLTAMEGGFRDDDYVNGRLVKFKNPDNLLIKFFKNAYNESPWSLGTTIMFFTIGCFIIGFFVALIELIKSYLGL